MVAIKSSKYIRNSYRKYSVYVNQTRAIPDARDGLKTGQRIALYLMRNKSSQIKTIALAGEMISTELYLHGEQAAADSISQLAAPFKNNIPLLGRTGNFGTLCSPSAASSPRYTYVDRPKYAEALIYPDFDIVPMIENHDGSRLMPENFLPLVPLSLLNGVDGIGVGYRARIMPRNINDLIVAIGKCIRGQKGAIPLIEPCFDSHDGSRGKFKEYNSKGQAVWSFKGQAEIVNSSNVIINALPPVNLTVEDFKKKLDEMIEAKSIKDYEDHSTDRVKIAIRLPRGKTKDWTENDALEFFGLIKEAAESVVFTTFDGQGIVQYFYDKTHQYPDPIERYLREWVEWRFAQYETRYKLLIEQVQDEMLYLKCIKACFDHKLPERISKKSNRADLRDDIAKCSKKNRLTATDDITERISNRATYTWTKDALEKLLEKLTGLERQLVKYEALAFSERLRRKQFETEVVELRLAKFDL